MKETCPAWQPTAEQTTPGNRTTRGFQPLWNGRKGQTKKLCGKAFKINACKGLHRKVATPEKGTLDDTSTFTKKTTSNKRA